MQIPKELVFSNIDYKKFDSNTKEYEMLNNFSDSEWSEYCNKMLKIKKTVRYDAINDNFVVKTFKDKSMNNILETLNLEDDISGLFDDSVEQTQTNSPLLTIEDFRNVLAEFLPKQTTVQKDELALRDDEIGESIVADESPILSSEFEELSDRVDAYEMSADTDYISSINGLNDNLEEVITEDNDSDKELLLDDDFDGEDDFSAESDEEEIEATVSYTPEKEISLNKEMNLCGMPVQIILTGVMITKNELSYIGESCKKENVTLKKISGKGKNLSIIVEYANKNYNIQYQDLPKNKTLTPFSIKEEKFKSLDEAIDKIKLPFSNRLKELKNFKKIVSKDLADRKISDINEATILQEFNGEVLKEYVKGWNVKNVGLVNLKSGLNETYSNILQHTKNDNTLVLNESGQYFLIKGNIKDRVKIGEKREISDIQGKKDYGTAKVIGFYENTAKGLGQIRALTKRLNIPLLVWR